MKGGRGRPLDRDVKRRVLQQYKDNVMTINEIAKEAHCSTATIAKWARDAGLSRKGSWSANARAAASARGVVSRAKPNPARPCRCLLRKDEAYVVEEGMHVTCGRIARKSQVLHDQLRADPQAVAA